MDKNRSLKGWCPWRTAGASHRLAGWGHTIVDDEMTKQAQCLEHQCMQVCTTALHRCFWHQHIHLRTHSLQGVHMRLCMCSLFITTECRTTRVDEFSYSIQVTCCWRRVLFLTDKEMKELSVSSLFFDGGGSEYGCMYVYTHTHTHTAHVD